MAHETSRWQGRVRAAALLLVSTLGLATIVGSGGAAFFPSCEGTNCYGPVSPIFLFVQVGPDHATAQVGTAVTFTVTAPALSPAATYRWQRWSDSQNLYVDIPGATAASYTLPAVNLADDGARFQVQVVDGLSGAGQARLAVVSTPGVVFSDTAFLASDWQAYSPTDVTGTTPLHSETQVASGGNPGAFRRMLSSQSQLVFHLSQTASYEPQTQGAVYVIDYAEDARTDQALQSGLVLEQNGRRYTTTGRPIFFVPTQWGAMPGSGSLHANEFVITDGPACGSGETCPDFSALGAPMRFGYWRRSSTTVVTTHDIDNWHVTVWRR